MAKATHASMTLARFDDMRPAGSVGETSDPGILFIGAAADVRAANSNALSQSAYKFLIFGLHSSEESARKLVSERSKLAPWLAESEEVWSAVLRPFRHFGEANFLNPDEAGPVFDVTAAPPDGNLPVVIATSVGWNSSEGEAMDRIKRFSDGVAAVRIGMTGLPGLQSQQSFSFPGGLVHDGLTVTIWRNLASAMAFAYGSGHHRKEVRTQREELYGDRTSFTRFSVLHSEGTWHGVDPMAVS